MITIHENVAVPAASDAVWGVVSDPSAVVACVPGAALGEKHDDGSFDANATVKFGPVRVTMQSVATLELDEAARTGHVTARGKDTQGGTRFTATMTFRVGEAPGGSAVAIDGEVELAGKLAGMIEAGANLVVKRMAGEFAENLGKRCAVRGGAQ